MDWTDRKEHLLGRIRRDTDGYGRIQMDTDGYGQIWKDVNKPEWAEPSNWEVPILIMYDSRMVACVASSCAFKKATGCARPTTSCLFVIISILY